MAISSIGYAGSVDEAEWAKLSRFAAGHTYLVAGPDDFRATPAGGDRGVEIATGVAAGAGIYDESDSPVTFNLPSVSSGSRWDLIGLERDWGTGTTSVDRIAGSASKAIPTRSTNPGVEDVQPLWLLRVTAGQTTIQEYVDLRAFVSDGGVWAADDLVKSYLDRVGTVLTIGDAVWTRRLSGSGTPEWVRSVEQGPKQRKIASSAAGTLNPSNGTINFISQQTIPAEPFGAGVDYDIVIDAYLLCSPASIGSTVLMTTLVDGGVPQVNSRTQVSASAFADMTVHHLGRHTITNPSSTHNVRVQIACPIGGVTIYGNVSGQNYEGVVLRLERVDSF